MCPSSCHLLHPLGDFTWTPDKGNFKPATFEECLKIFRSLFTARDILKIIEGFFTQPSPSSWLENFRSLILLSVGRMPFPVPTNIKPRGVEFHS